MVGGGDARAMARPPPPPPPPPPWPAAVEAEQTRESPQGLAAPASEGQGLAAFLENVELWQRQLLELEIEVTTDEDTLLLGHLLGQAFKLREAALRLRVLELSRSIARGSAQAGPPTRRQA